MAPGGSVHLPTDDAELVAFAEEAVRSVGGQLLRAGNANATDEDETAIQTTYERKYRTQGRTIYERQFLLPRVSRTGVHTTGRRNAVSSSSTLGGS